MLLHRLGNDSPSDVCCYCGGGIIKASASAEEKSLCQSDVYAIQFLEPPWKLRQECDATCRALMQHEVSNVQWPSQHSWQGFRRKWQRTAFQTVFIYNMNDKHPETPSSVLLAFRTLWGTALMPCQTRCACGQEGTKTGLETWTWDFAMTHVTIRILMSIAKRMRGFWGVVCGGHRSPRNLNPILHNYPICWESWRLISLRSRGHEVAALGASTLTKAVWSSALLFESLFLRRLD